MGVVLVTPGVPDPSAESRFASKTVTFDGTSGKGQNGSSTVWFTVSGGLVLIQQIAGRVTTNLTGATATLTLGVVGSTSLFIGVTTSTALTTAAEIWMTTTPTAAGLALPAACKDIVVDANIVSLAGTADTTGGVIVMNCIWKPLTAGATLT